MRSVCRARRVARCAGMRADVKIARPLLAVTTPLGIAIGLREAWRFHWWLAGLMAALLTVLGAGFFITVRRIRAESSAPPGGIR